MRACVRVCGASVFVRVCACLYTHGCFHGRARVCLCVCLCVCDVCAVSCVCMCVGVFSAHAGVVFACALVYV